MKRVRVSAAVIHKEGAILATRRAKGTFKGFWEFPGGKREEGESGEEAIIREIKEELDVDINVEKFLTTIEYQYPEFFLVMDVYIATISKGEVILIEHDDARWLGLDELELFKWLPADKKILEMLQMRNK